MTGTSTAVAFTVAPRRGDSPAYWRLSPDAAMTTSARPVADLEEAASAAVRNADAASLLMVLADAVEAGNHRIAGSIARAALDQNMRDLPDISAERLHALAIAGGVSTDVVCVRDLQNVAAQLRDSALMHEIGFGLTSGREDPSSLASSLTAAAARADRLASRLNELAAGGSLQLAPLIGQLSFFGLLNVARGLANICTFGDGVSGLEVAIAAQIRHRLGAARGLRAQLEIIQRSPANTAARNSACACLVDLGMPQEALDHLAVSLLRPDHYSGNTARRALRVAGYHDLSRLADAISVEMAGRHPSEATERVRRMATRILIGIGRRAHAELSMVGLLEVATPAVVFADRCRYDSAVTAR